MHAQRLLNEGVDLKVFGWADQLSKVEKWIPATVRIARELGWTGETQVKEALDQIKRMRADVDAIAIAGWALRQMGILDDTDHIQNVIGEMVEVLKNIIRASATE